MTQRKQLTGMGQVQSQIDARHVGIYKKLLAIQNPQTRLQMIDTLMGDPGVVHSAKVAGIYGNLLQVAGAIRHGQRAPLLPGEGPQQQPQQPQQATNVPRIGMSHPAAIQTQLVSHAPPQQNYYQQVAKPKQKEKALNFFTACLKVLGIEEEVALTEDTLKSAYKKAVIKAHPDKGGSKDAFDAVTRAYAYLGDILQLVKGQKGTTAKDAPVMGLDTAMEQRKAASQEWQMPAQPVRLDPKNLNMKAFNEMFEQTRVPDPDEDGYGDWLKDEGGGKTKKLKNSKKFSEDFNREVFNRMFEEEQGAEGNSGQLIQFQHPQELILSPSAGVELGRDRPNDYTAAYDSDLQFTDLRSAYTKENTVSEKVKNVRVEARDFNTYKAQREKAPDAYNASEMAALQAYEAQQKMREEQRRIRAAQEQVGARDYFERMKQLVITHK